VACIVNANKDILAVSRVSDQNHWQLPQGGRESGETIEMAALREVKEEVGMVSLTVIGRTAENLYRYSWKRRYQANNQGINFSRRSAYKGQAQTIVYLQFTGLETEITLDTIEHDAWQWVSQKDLMQFVHPVRRPIVALALTHLPETLKQSYE
jgi:putative (di)nucleoside polyphosphate hydrolase